MLNASFLLVSMLLLLFQFHNLNEQLSFLTPHPLKNVEQACIKRSSCKLQIQDVHSQQTLIQKVQICCILLYTHTMPLDGDFQYGFHDCTIEQGKNIQDYTLSNQPNLVILFKSIYEQNRLSCPVKYVALCMCQCTISY